MAKNATIIMVFFLMIFISFLGDLNAERVADLHFLTPPRHPTATPRFMAPGPWCMIHGSWFLVCGSWFMVHGS